MTISTTTTTPPPCEPVNYALSTNGSTATATSTYESYVPSYAINGEVTGWYDGSWRGWHSLGYVGLPQDFIVNFNDIREIDEIDMFTCQDASTSPSTPTLEMTFSLYGITAYTISYDSTGANNWIQIVSVTGNNKVWRKHTFPAVMAYKVKLHVIDTVDDYIRLVELECWGGCTTPTTTTTTPPPPGWCNIALATNGSTATAQSTYSSAYAASKVIDGNRAGGTENYWNQSGTGLPQWIQVDFDKIYEIGEVDLFSVQDAYSSPSTPTPGMTFSNYGITAGTIQAKLGNTWTTVDTISGNNLVWYKATFAHVNASAVRVNISGVPDNVARCTELEVWGVCGEYTTTTTPAPTDCVPVDNGSVTPQAVCYNGYTYDFVSHIGDVFKYTNANATVVDIYYDGSPVWYRYVGETRTDDVYNVVCACCVCVPVWDGNNYVETPNKVCYNGSNYTFYNYSYGEHYFGNYELVYNESTGIWTELSGYTDVTNEVSCGACPPPPGVCAPTGTCDMYGCTDVDPMYVCYGSDTYGYSGYMYGSFTYQNATGVQIYYNSDTYVWTDGNSTDITADVDCGACAGFEPCVATYINEVISPAQVCYYDIQYQTHTTFASSYAYADEIWYGGMSMKFVPSTGIWYYNGSTPCTLQITCGPCALPANTCIPSAEGTPATVTYNSVCYVYYDNYMGTLWRYNDGNGTIISWSPSQYNWYDADGYMPLDLITNGTVACGGECSGGSTGSTGATGSAGCIPTEAGVPSVVSFNNLTWNYLYTTNGAGSTPAAYGYDYDGLDSIEYVFDYANYDYYGELGLTSNGWYYGGQLVDGQVSC
jgi:hypothetical protein